MPLMFYNYQLLIAEGDNWENGTSSYNVNAIKDGCRFRIKNYRSTPYPDKRTMSLTTFEYRRKECLDLLNLRIQINEQLKKVDAGDCLLAYAENVFLNETPPYAGVVEVVPFVEGAVDVHKHLGQWEWMGKLCLSASEALFRMHEIGLMHTDIKPENMIITQDSAGHPHVTLIDFDECTQDGNMQKEACGTPRYNAPEQQMLASAEDDEAIEYWKKSIRLSTDVYCLGASLLEMMTGELPKVDFKARRTIWSQDSIPVQYIRTIIEGMLAFQPENRPSIDAVMASLQAKTYIPVLEKVTLWPEHAETLEFNQEREKDIHKMTQEIFNGEKGYQVVFANGEIRHYSLSQVRNSYLLVLKNENNDATTISSMISELLPEDATYYTVDETTMKKYGFSKLIYETGNYYLVRENGRKIKTDRSLLIEFYKIFVRKD